MYPTVNRIDNLQSPKERISYIKIASDTLRVSSMAYRMMSFSVFATIGHFYLGLLFWTILLALRF